MAETEFCCAGPGTRLVQIVLNWLDILCHLYRSFVFHEVSDMLRFTGSVIGQLLFLLYTADLADLAAKHGVTLYAFVDDTQLYIHCKFKNMATWRDVLECCIQDIGH